MSSSPMRCSPSVTPSMPMSPSDPTASPCACAASTCPNAATASISPTCLVLWALARSPTFTASAGSSKLNNKLDKSSHRLDEIDARNPAAVHALIHASIIASVLVGLIVHRHNLAIANTSSTTRTQPPLHHGLVARMLATCAFRIADALDLQGPDADAEWEHLAAVIVHMGKDPNWRRNPSVLDQFRGWMVLPSSRPRRSTLARRA